MIRKRLFSVLASLFVLTLLAAGPSFGQQAVSPTVQTPVQLSIPESISLTTNTNAITLTTVAPSASVTLTAGWQIQTGHTSATIYAYFSALPGNSGGTLSASLFQTQYNGGAAVVCTVNGFGNTGIGHAGQDCGTFNFPNIGTDLNDSQNVTLTVTYTGGSNIPTGTYTGGVLNLVFQIV